MAANYVPEILQAAAAQGIPGDIYLALLLHESGLDPNATYNDGKYGVDRGIAQINDLSHPDITDAQAFDPAFAIPWGAQYLAAGIQQCGGVWQGVAFYNLGHCGPDPAYISAVYARLPEAAALIAGAKLTGFSAVRPHPTQPFWVTAAAIAIGVALVWAALGAI